MLGSYGAVWAHTHPQSMAATGNICFMRIRLKIYLHAKDNVFILKFVALFVEKQKIKFPGS
jgi:hypothetical protein